MYQQMQMANKNDVMRAISEVLQTLDGGITVNGVQNAGNLAAAFMVLNQAAAFLSVCEITPPKSEGDEEQHESKTEEGMELG